MASKKSVEEQLKRIRFSAHAWGRSEVSELPNILMDDEKIFECVNGMYEGGFALLVATDIRVLLIDKKPFNYLTVEDLRFDMINQIDYGHRLMGAKITISAGSKNLYFKSYNQPRLRKLINHVQSKMANTKKEQSSSAETQQQHLERINEQLQTYLLAQHKHQQELHEQLKVGNNSQKAASANSVDELIKSINPSPELSDYLYAQSLMKQYEIESSKSIESEAPTYTAQIEAQKPQAQLTSEQTNAADATQPVQEPAQPMAPASVYGKDVDEMYAAGLQEVFGKRLHQAGTAAVAYSKNATSHLTGFEINPLKVACAKLPTVLHNRKFGLPTIAMPSYTLRTLGRTQLNQ